MNGKAAAARRQPDALNLLRSHHRRLRVLLRALSRRAGIEDVHRARVAVRRLRTLISGLASAIDPQHASTLQELLRRLAHELGRVRDADIRAEVLLPMLRELPEAADGRSTAASALQRSLRMARLAARRQLHARLHSTAFRGQLQVTSRLMAEEGLFRPAADSGRILRAALQRRHRKLDNALRKGARTADQRHALRIQIKKYRYLRDACEGRPPRTDKEGKRLERLQDDLGGLNDLAQTKRWLKQQELDPRLTHALRKRLRSRGRALRSHLEKSWPR